MASLIPGYEYDIFISYRQKDNKHDGWVTEFVDNLKGELESTFKEEISVYFDINPHDGLLETYDVDASLKEKLNCLIFIPILSRTYCDPRSFAWEHEFKAFVEQASQDQFGLKVKLLNGNIANRVLPVRIHDLDNDDMKLYESILDGVLRGIEFIYKEPGVNRPLTPEDDEKKNLYGSKYRNQINKIANAIDEIIHGLKQIHTSLSKEKSLLKEEMNQNNIEYFNDGLSASDNQIPLQTLVKDRNKNTSRIQDSRRIWYKNIKNYIFSILVISSLLALVFSWKGPSRLFGIGKSKREHAKSHVENAVKYFDNKEYVEAKGELQLALSSDPKYSPAWSTLAAVSVNQGKLNDAVLQTIEAIKLDPTNNKAAYNLAYALDDKKDSHQAIIWYSKAIELDSTFVPAYSALGNIYNRLNQPIDAILILTLAKDKYPQSEYIYLIYKNLGNAFLLQDQLYEAIKYLELSKEINQNEPETNLYLAKAYEAAGKVTRSIEQWQNYIDLETDTIKINEAKMHLKEITIIHLKKIIK
jgi:tetratricopeptide (TPR) repeat protein